jgi:hypothetical protein
MNKSNAPINHAERPRFVMKQPGDRSDHHHGHRARPELCKSIGFGPIT